MPPSLDSGDREPKKYRSRRIDGNCCPSANKQRSCQTIEVDTYRDQAVPLQQAGSVLPGAGPGGMQCSTMGVAQIAGHPQVEQLSTQFADTKQLAPPKSAGARTGGGGPSVPSIVGRAVKYRGEEICE